MLQPLPHQSTTLFIMAHQDDEFGIFGEIELCLSDGNRAIMIYLTDGGAGKAAPSIRNQESISVLRSLGVQQSDIHFMGYDLGIPDGHLVDHLDQAYSAVIDISQHAKNVTKVVMHAWEGGHQDHDAAHLVGIAIARKYGVIGASRQFPLYRRDPRSQMPFVMFRPLSANGDISTTSIPLARRVGYIALMTRYRSQKKTFLGLMPLILWHYTISGTQLLQPVNLARIDNEPHAGQLLYEKRSPHTYKEFRQRSGAFREQIAAMPLTSR